MNDQDKTKDLYTSISYKEQKPIIVSIGLGNTWTTGWINGLGAAEIAEAMFRPFDDLYARLVPNKIDLGSMLFKGLFPPGNTLFREKGHWKPV